MREPKTASSGFTDIAAGGWIDRHGPALARPYLRLMRLDRPIGTWLLLFPCWWSLAMAAPPGALPDLGLVLLFAIGAIAMRGAGCTYNDIVDRDFDARVERTARRPIPSGAVSVRAAIVFLAGQLGLGLVVLLQLNGLAIGLGIASLGLIAAYPFMKRWTYWPQAFLGATFNWGALMGFAAATGRIEAPAVLLYAAGIAWTLSYDTIYAHQDKEDDALIGVKSTALRFGDASRTWIAGFALLSVMFMAAALAAAGMAWPAWAGLAGAAAHLAWQARTVDFGDPASCLAVFRSNRWVGWILFAGIVLGRWLA
jgi:4-hydroxybenzoate polyprenyltransferase